MYSEATSGDELDPREALAEAIRRIGRELALGTPSDEFARRQNLAPALGDGSLRLYPWGADLKI